MSGTESTTLGQDLRFGSWGRGTVSAIVSLITIVVLPFVVLYFLEYFMEVSDVEGLEGLIESFGDMIYRFAIYGLPIVALAFFNKAYDKGSKAKLLFTLISLGYSLMWIYLIFEGGTMSVSLDLSSMVDEDFPVGAINLLLSIKGFIIIMYILILLKMVIAFTKYGSNRDKYMEKYNTARADREFKPSVNTTFREDLGKGSLGKGLLSVVVGLLVIVLIPYVLINYSELLLEKLDYEIDDEIVDFLAGLLYRFSYYGIPVVILGFFTHFYSAGNKAWLVFKTMSLAYMFVWVLMIFEMGDIVVPFESEILFEIEEYVITSYEIVLSVIIIILLYILFKLLAAVASFGRKRNGYLRKLEESADGNKHSD
ncbi:MAG: hypothetical protein ACOX1N_03940 [Candidatus Methanomethylophilaceae archaeon]|jgi:hypothetical protein